MILIVVFVVVGASVLLIGLLIVGSQRCWRYCDWGYKGGAEQGRIPEAGHSCLLPVGGAIVAPNGCRASGERNEQNTRKLVPPIGARSAAAGVQKLHVESGTCERRAPRRHERRRCCLLLKPLPRGANKVFWHAEEQHPDARISRLPRFGATLWPASLCVLLSTIAAGSPLLYRVGIRVGT
jgi:hypothetical protein